MWKNKNDKIKRSVIYQSLLSGRLNFPIFKFELAREVFKPYKGIMASNPKDSFNRYRGLPFLLKCNYDSKLLENNGPLFYSEMSDYVK